MAGEKTTLTIETIFKQNGQKNMEQAAFAMNRGWKKNAASMLGLTKETRGFKMELLSVMFFGQGIARLFGGLLGPAAELFSIFELWQTALAIVFLPIMEALFPYFMMLFDWMVNMPEPMKLVIGAFALFMTVLGTIMGVIGAVSLGLQGMAMALGFPNALSLATAVFSGISAAFLAFAAIIAVVVAGIYLAWTENFMNIKGWFDTWIGGIKQAFIGLFTVLSGMVKFWVSFFKGDLNSAKIAFFQMIEGMKNYLTGLGKILISAVTVILIGIYRLISGVQSFFIGVGELIGNKLAEGIKMTAARVKDAILSLFPSWARDLIWKTGQFVISIFTKKSGSGGSSGGGEASGGSEDDFVWRPGQGPVSINPGDTLVGFKGTPPNLGGGSGVSVNITQNLTITGGLKEEISRMISDNNKRLVDDIKRLSSGA